MLNAVPLENWYSFFSVKYVAADISCISQGCLCLDDLNWISLESVWLAANKLNKDSAPGLDGLTVHLILNGGAPLYSFLAWFFKQVLIYSFIPDRMAAVIISPVLKKQGLDGKDLNNYRPITTRG